MTEQEYINVQALGVITATISTLEILIPENVKDIAPKDEYDHVMSLLHRWHERLIKTSKIE